MCRRQRNRCGYGASTCGYGRSGPRPVDVVTQLGALVLNHQHQKDQRKAQTQLIGPPPPEDALASQLDQPWRQPIRRARPNPNLADRPPSYHSYLPPAHELHTDDEKACGNIAQANACSADMVGQPRDDMPYTAPHGGVQIHSEEEPRRIDMRSTTASSLSLDSDSDSDDDSIFTPATSISGRDASGQCENCGHHAQRLHHTASVNGSSVANTYDHLPWRDVRGGKYGRKAEKKQRKYARRAGGMANGEGAQDAMYALVEAKFARKALRWHRKRCSEMGCWCAGA